MNRFARLIFAAVLLALAGCDQRISTVKAALSHDLLDPDSAKWRNVKVVEDYTDGGGHVSVVCGEINSKNRMGGMVGFDKFFYIVSHIYPNKIPGGSEKILPSNTYHIYQDVSGDSGDSIFFDNHGIAISENICGSGGKSIRSDLVDFRWADPCSGTAANTDPSLRSLDEDGGPASPRWIAWQLIGQFPEKSREEICRYILSHKQEISDYAYSGRDHFSDKAPPGDDPRIYKSLIRIGRQSNAIYRSYAIKN